MRVFALAAALLALAWSAANASFPPRGGATVGGPPAAAGTPVAIASSSYVLPATSSQPVGTLTTTISGGSGPATYSLVTTGSDISGLACPSNGATQFSLSGASLSTASGFAAPAQQTAYVCVKSTIGSSSLTQRLMLNQDTPRFTAYQAIGGSQTAAGAFAGYWQQNSPAYGWTLTNRGSSSTTLACANAIGTFISDATGTIGTTGNPMFSVVIGEDDALANLSSYDATYKDCLAADLAWLAIPSKVLATSATKSPNPGGWSSYSATGLSAGTALKSSTVNDSLTFTVPVKLGDPSNTVHIGTLFAWVGSTGATAPQISYAIDGGSATTITLDNYPNLGIQPIIVTGLTVATHTIKITVVSAGGGQVIVVAAGAPNTSWADQVAVAGVLKQQSDANPTVTAAYDKDTADVADLLDFYGLDIIYVPVRNYVNTSTDYASTLNLNQSGQTHVAQAFQEHWYPCLVAAVDASASPVTPPAPATGAGFYCLVFDEEGNSNATIDQSNTFAPGFNFYGGAPSPGPSWPFSARTASFQGYSPTPIVLTSFATDASGMAMRYSETPTLGNSVGPSTCAPTAGAHASPAVPPYVVGQFLSPGAGFYDDSKVTSTVSDYYATWFFPKELLSTNVSGLSTITYYELDNPDEGFNNAEINLWNTVISTDANTSVVGSYRTSSGPPLVSGRVYGVLALSGVANGTGTETIKWYFDDVQTTTAGGDGFFDLLLTTHACRIANGYGSTSAHIRFWRTWQQPL